MTEEEKIRVIEIYKEYTELNDNQCEYLMEIIEAHEQEKIEKLFSKIRNKR